MIRLFVLMLYIVEGVKVMEDPDAQCTKKTELNGARQKESQ